MNREQEEAALVSGIEIRGPGECWPWKRCRRGKGWRDGGGYGYCRWHGRQQGAHRAVYEFEHGPIPDGLEIRHTCDNPTCCNPSHLLVGTHAQNMADMAERGRSTRGRRIRRGREVA